jgi:4-amino-4-deoxy-L-arabinose transferase-like glycosyltransferase
MQENVAAPGMYYDEAVFAGLAKDFVVGQKRLHMPGCERITVFNRPFPVFVQPYIGALKSWIFIPSFGLFGASLAIVRLTTAFLAIVSLLFFMLGVKRWLGSGAAILGGTLFALDPTWFFLGTLDWGAAVPALLCRCLAFYLGSIWWRGRSLVCLFLAGFFLGLGVFNKIDLLVFITAIGIAGLVFYARDIWHAAVSKWCAACVALVAFLLPMALTLPRIGKVLIVAEQTPSLTSELGEKLHTFLALYNGSYFYRVMEVGGLFDKMYGQPAAVYVPLLPVLVIALMAVAFSTRDKNRLRVIGFLLTSLLLTTAGVLLLPGAVRIHHAFLIFPLPQLIIATAFAFLWNDQRPAFARRVTRSMTAIGLFILFATQVYAIARTEKLITETGGRGRWSNALDRFCADNRDRSDTVIASLDWGFNEQLAFLTDAPQLVEPFWAFPAYKGNLPPLPPRSNYIYLVHSPEYSLFRYDLVLLQELQSSGENVDIQPHSDRQGQVVFYTIQFRE